MLRANASARPPPRISPEFWHPFHRQNSTYLQEVVDILDKPMPLVGKVYRVIGIRDYGPNPVDSPTEVGEQFRLGKHGRVRILISGDLCAQSAYPHLSAKYRPPHSHDP
jgi:hypothetical protein